MYLYNYIYVCNNIHNFDKEYINKKSCIQIDLYDLNLSYHFNIDFLNYLTIL